MVAEDRRLGWGWGPGGHCVPPRMVAGGVGGHVLVLHHEESSGGNAPARSARRRVTPQEWEARLVAERAGGLGTTWKLGQGPGSLPAAVGCPPCLWCGSHGGLSDVPCSMSSPAQALADRAGPASQKVLESWPGVLLCHGQSIWLWVLWPLWSDLPSRVGGMCPPRAPRSGHGHVPEHWAITGPVRRPLLCAPAPAPCSSFSRGAPLHTCCSLLRSALPARVFVARSLTSCRSLLDCHTVRGHISGGTVARREQKPRPPL